jgi:hypothetical protein
MTRAILAATLLSTTLLSEITLTTLPAWADPSPVCGAVLTRTAPRRAAGGFQDRARRGLGLLKMDEHEVAALGGDLGLKSLETISGSGLHF